MRRKSSLLIVAIPFLISISACAQNETPTGPTISPASSPPASITTPATINPTTSPDLEATVVSAVQATVSAALTATVVAAPSPTATATTTPTPTATAMATSESIVTATAEPEPIATAAAEPEPIATATAEPEPIATAAVEPEPIVTATVEPEPIATAAPTPQVEAQYHVRIQNVDLAGEVVVVVNTGASPQAMTDWELLSQEGGQRFVFPRFTLDSGDTVLVTSGPNGRQDPPGVLQWLKSDGSPYRGHIWNNDGDVAILFDSGGNEVSRFPQT